MTLEDGAEIGFDTRHQFYNAESSQAEILAADHILLLAAAVVRIAGRNAFQPDIGVSLRASARKGLIYNL